MRKGLVFRLVGMVVIYVGAAMLVPFLVSLHYEDGSASAILYSALISMGCGFFLFHFNKNCNAKDISVKDGFGVVGFSWLFASLFGSLPFILSGAIPNWSFAFFETVSGFTTTGASILTNIEAMPKGLLFWRSFTHWMGGMGILLLSIAILPFLGLGGMAIFKAESSGPTKDKLRPRIQETAKLLWMVYLLFSATCLIMLKLAGMNWFDATCHMFGTVATGGYSNYNASLAHFHSPLYEYIIMFFMFICGMSFSLHYLALTGQPGVYFKNTEWRLYVAIIVVASTICYLTRLNEHIPMEQNIRDSLFSVLTLTTCTGFVTADFEAWHPLAQATLVLVTLAGGCAGSTAGGLKTVRLVLLGKYLKNSLNNQIHPSGVFSLKLDGVPVKREVIQNTVGFVFVSFLVIMSAAYLLTAYGVDILTAVTGSITCFSNAGPGLGLVGPTDSFANIPADGIWVLSALMLFGRLEVYCLMILLMPQTWRR